MASDKPSSGDATPPKADLSQVLGEIYGHPPARPAARPDGLEHAPGAIIDPTQRWNSGVYAGLPPRPDRQEPTATTDPTQSWNSDIYSGLSGRVQIHTSNLWQRESVTPQSTIVGNWADGANGIIYGAGTSPEQKALLRLISGYADTMRHDPVLQRTAKHAAVAAGANHAQMDEAMWRESIKGISAYLTGGEGNDVSAYMRFQYGPVHGAPLQIPPFETAEVVPPAETRPSRPTAEERIGTGGALLSVGVIASGLLSLYGDQAANGNANGYELPQLNFKPSP